MIIEPFRTSLTFSQSEKETPHTTTFRQKTMVISAPQSPARSVRSVAFAESVSGNSHGSSSVQSFGSFRKKPGSSDVKKVINGKGEILDKIDVLFSPMRI